MIKELCNISGISGFESEVVDLIVEKLKNVNVDKLYIDRVGNLVCVKKGRSGERKIMVTAHVDEVGFQVVKEISEQKYRVKPLGNVKTWNAFQQRVISKDIVGVLYAFNEDNLKAHNYENLYLKPIGGKQPETGDVFSFESNFHETNKYYCGKALDNRLACGILIDLIKKDVYTEADVYFVFTVQEEVGMRGARVAKTSINPDLCISIDTSAECEMSSIILSNGVGIKISDSMSISTVEVVKWLKKLAIDNDVQYQMEVSDCGTSELIISNELDNGCHEVGISIPCKFLHSANAIVNKKDFYECEKLLSAIISCI